MRDRGDQDSSRLHSIPSDNQSVDCDRTRQAISATKGDLSSFDTFAQTMGFDGSTLQQALSNAKSFIDGLR